jgi:hypothetical protein
MLEKLMADLGALRANKHSEVLSNAVSRSFSEIMDVNNIYVLSGDANWEKILRRCYAAERVRRKYGNDVKEWHCCIIESVSLRLCFDTQPLPGPLRQSTPVPLSEGFMHKLASAGFHSRPATRHSFIC